MAEILHREGNDRTETIQGAGSLIKQLAKTRKIPIDVVKDRPFDNTDTEANDWKTDSSSSEASSGVQPDSSSSSSSEDLDPEDSASCVAERSHPKNKQQSSQQNSKKTKPMTAAALKREKAFALWKYKKCNPDYCYSPICLDMNNTLEEIEDELAKVKEQNEIDNAVDVCRKIMTSVVGGAELISKKQKFFDLRLNGWSEMVAFEAENAKYDGVFSELYDEYRDSIQMSPWWKLAWLLGGSAVHFHILNAARDHQQPIQPVHADTEIPKANIDIDEIMARMRAAQEKAQMNEPDCSGGESDVSSVVSAVSSSASALSTNTQPRGDPDAVSRVSRLRTTLQKRRAAQKNITTPVAQPAFAAQIIAPPTPTPTPTELPAINEPITISAQDGAAPNASNSSEPQQDLTIPTEAETPTPPAATPVKPKRVYKRKVPPTTATSAKPKVVRKTNKSEPTTSISTTTAHPTISKAEDAAPHPESNPETNEHE